MDDCIVCEFADSHDYFLLRTLPDSMDEWVDNFRVIDKRRSRFLKAISWWLKSNNVNHSVLSFHIWVNENGCTFGIPLGRDLTEFLHDHNEFEAFEKLCVPSKGIPEITFEQCVEKGLFEGIGIPARLDDQPVPKYEYEENDSEACKRLLGHLSSLGYSLCETFRGDCWIGRACRECQLDINSIRTEAHANTWLQQHNIPLLSDKTAGNEIECRALSNGIPELLPTFGFFSTSDVQKIARRLIDSYVSLGIKKPHVYWADPFWYNAEKDTWVDEGWWKHQAKQYKDDVLLAVLGDEEVRNKICEKLKSYADFGWSGSFSIYEGLCPLKAYLVKDHVWPKENPADFYCEEDSYPGNVFWRSYFPNLPYEIKRRASAAVRDTLVEGDWTEKINYALRVFSLEEIGTFFTSREITLIHDFCMREANQRYPDGFIKTHFLEIAHFFGWEDIVEALDRNESFWELWITWPEQLDSLGDITLVLSLFDCGKPMVKRLASWFLMQDANALASKISTEVGGLGADAYDLQEQQLAAAIAWLRAN